MGVNLGTAIGYLELNTSKFQSGFKSAMNDLKVFQSNTATSQDKMKGLSSAMGTVGSTLSKKVTVPLVGIGAAALKVGGNFDAGMSKVKAISGATAGDMVKLRDKAKEMGAKTKFSATESAEAFQYMAMAGWKTNDMLQGIDGIMNLSAADGLDLATTSDIVTDAITAFGLTAKDSTHFADVLAQTSRNANTNVSMLGESFKYVAPVAGAMGYSVEDTSVALGLMANSGIKASQAGTSLRSMITNLAKPTDTQAALMEKLGISLTDNEGNMKPLNQLLVEMREKFKGLSEEEKANYAATLAGKEGMSGFLAIVNASDKDFNALTDAIGDSNGAAKEMADEMLNNLPGAITLFKSAMEGLLLRIHEVIEPVATKVVQAVTWIVSKLSEMPDAVIFAITALGALAAAAGPTLLILSKVVLMLSKFSGATKIVLGAVKSISGGIKGLTSVLKLAGTGFKALGSIISIAFHNPLLLIIAAVAAFVVAIIFNFGGLRDKLAGILETIKEKFSGFFTAVKEGWSNFWQSIADFFSTIGHAIKNKVIEIFTGIKDFFSNTFASIKESVKGFLSSFKNLWNSAMSGVSSFFKQVWNGIKDFFGNILSNIKGKVSGFASSFKNIWSNVWNGAKSVVSNVWNSIKSVVKNAFESIITIISNVKNKVKNAAKKVFDGIKDGFVDKWNGIKKWMSTAFSAIGKILTNAGKGLFNIGKNMFTNLWNGFKNVWNAISNWLNGVKDALVNIWNNIKNAVTGANNARNNVSAGRTALPSHANGLYRVPYDGYVAELHKGERVLTAKEAAAYNAGASPKLSGQYNFNFYNPQALSPAEQARQFKKTMNQLLFNM